MTHLPQGGFVLNYSTWGGDLGRGNFSGGAVITSRNAELDLLVVFLRVVFGESELVPSWRFQPNSMYHLRSNTRIKGQCHHALYF